MGFFRTVHLGIFLVVSALAHDAAAQDGAYDPTFAFGGRRLVNVASYGIDIASRLRVLPDGRLLVGGLCYSDQFTFNICLTRLRANGSGYDAGFGPGGVGYVNFGQFAGFPVNAGLSDMALLPDGRIAVLGSYGSGGQPVLAVLQANGAALDAWVGGGAGYFEFDFGGQTYASSLALQPDGKLVVGGSVNGDTNADFAALRWRADLSAPDPDFGTNGVQTIGFDLGGPAGSNADIAASVALDTSGRVLLAGYAYESLSPALAAAAFVRLLPNGQPDTDYGVNGDARVALYFSAVNNVRCAQLDASGRLVFAGTAASSTNADQRWLVGRLRADGVFDPTFNAGTPQRFEALAGAARETAYAVTLQPGGRIVVAGTVTRLESADETQNWWAAARLNTNGSLDATFGNLGRVYGTYTPPPPVGPGSFGWTDNGRDVGFNGGIVIAGSGRTTQNGATRFGVVRLTVDVIFADGLE